MWSNVVVLLALLNVFPPLVRSQTNTPWPDAEISTNTSSGFCPCPDVLLNVPNLSVGEIDLTVSNLTARVNLDVNAANLVSIKAGVDVAIDQVQLTIKDVQAQLRLEVRLENIVTIVNRTLSSLDLNPLLNRVLDTVDLLVTSLTNVVSDFVNSLGQRIVQTIDKLANVVNNVVSSTGQIVGQTVLGPISQLLSLTSTTINSVGDTVKRFTSATGAIVDITYHLVNGVEQIAAVNVIQQGSGGIVPSGTTPVPTGTPTLSPTNTPTNTPTTQAPTTSP